MNADEFKARTQKLALRIGRLADVLPSSRSADIYGKQLIRSSSSVGANYRAVCRAKSLADMINKLKIVEEEADETLYWLELVAESNLVPRERIADLMRETNEILSMVVASLRTLRKKKSKGTD